jgi:membrane fusion protein, multidrug efflux system
MGPRPSGRALRRTKRGHMRPSWRSVSTVLLVSLSLAACERPKPPAASAATPVRAVAVRVVDYAPSLTLTGEIAARVQSDLSFRVGGRIIERKAEIGMRVAADTVLARLDPAQQEADLRAATASVQAAEAQLRQANANFARQQALLDKGFTTRKAFDEADQSRRTSQSALDSARAAQATARDTVSYTVLRAGAPGVIVARAAEVGQVVQAAQTVFTLAQDGPRDAVFYVQESVLVHGVEGRKVELALVNDPSVRTTGTVREVAPAADPTTGAVRVKVGLDDPPPPAFALGAAVTGTGTGTPQKLAILPASSLTSDLGRPAVWVVDRASHAVTLRRIDIARYETESIVVREGLASGELVVTAGTQMLRPQQKVELVEAKA